METMNIMVYLHTSAGIITIDKTLYVAKGSDDLEVERALRSILNTSQEYLVLDDAVSHKRCIIEPKNILFISYDVELFSRKLFNIRQRQAEKKIKEGTRSLSKEELEILFTGSSKVDIGYPTYENSIPGNLTVENPSKSTVLSDISPDWLINVDHTTKVISTEEFLDLTKK